MDLKRMKPRCSPMKRLRSGTEERQGEPRPACMRFRDIAKSAMMTVPFGCGLLFLCLLKLVFFLGYVPSASMEPVIMEGSFIFGIRIYGELRRGDIVVFELDGRLLVKRITGIPGDAVQTIEGDSLVVPDGCYFLTGDNQNDSVDSRYWNNPFIRKDAVIAIVRE